MNTQDLLSCSYTCWTWNNLANIILYRSVDISSLNKFKKFLNTVSTPVHDACARSKDTNHKRQPLGELVKAIRLQYADRFEYMEDSHHAYLEDLASICPNVHSITTYEDNDLISHILSIENYDCWQKLGAKWPLLKSVAIHSSHHFGHSPYPSRGIETIFARLHHLDLLRCNYFLLHFPVRPSSVTQLQSLKVRVDFMSDYGCLKALVDNCRDTLETLAISWKAPDTGENPQDLGPLILDSPHLKKFGLEWKSNSSFRISSFGDQLYELELQGRNSGRIQRIDEEIGRALTRTSNLKRLSLTGVVSLAEYIPLLLHANSDTLQEFYLSDRNAHLLLTNLNTTGTLLFNVTVLHINTKNIEASSLRMVPEIFPRIEFLQLVLPAKMKASKRFLAHIFSQLECLKGVNVSTRTSNPDSDPAKDRLKDFKFPYAKYQLKRPLFLY